MLVPKKKVQLDPSKRIWLELCPNVIQSRPNYRKIIS